MLGNRSDAAPTAAAAEVQRGRQAFTLDARYIAWFSVGLVVLMAASAFVAFVMLGGVRVARPGNAAVTRPPEVAAMPVLQSAPAGELQNYRREKAARLESYGWVDRAGGVVHVPIERAMQLLAEERR